MEPERHPAPLRPASRPPPAPPSQPPAPRTLHAARNLVLARLISTVGKGFGLLPLGAAVRIGGLLGAGAYRILRRERRWAFQHLGVAFPGMTPQVRTRIAREAFYNAGQSFAELAQWRRLKGRLGELITIEGLEHLHRGFAFGRGVVAVTGHLGNWELLAATFAERGYPLTVVARRVNDDRFDDLVTRFRYTAGVRTIRRDDPHVLRRMIGALRGGGILALLVDQDTRGPGVFVPFFGHLAHTSPGAAVITLRTRAPLVSVFIERRKRGHRVRIEPLYGFQPVPGRRPSVEELTARITAAIEEQIRRCPGEWVWWHRRWRRQPPVRVPFERSA